MEDMNFYQITKSRYTNMYKYGINLVRSAIFDRFLGKLIPYFMHGP